MAERDTKDLGERTVLRVRLGPEAQEAAEAVAKLIPLPLNSVLTLGVMLLAAQFAPFIHDKGLSLDLLEEELRSLFAEARRVVPTSPAPPRKS